jgi:hypothetical protein
MQNDYKNLGRATHCSMGFLIFFTAYNSSQNMQPQVLQSDGYGRIGFLTLALIYLSVAISCFLVTNVTSKLGETKSLALAGILTSPYYLVFVIITQKHYNPELDSFIYSPAFVYTLVSIFSILNGFAAALLWVA